MQERHPSFVDNPSALCHRKPSGPITRQIPVENEHRPSPIHSSTKSIHSHSHITSRNFIKSLYCCIVMPTSNSDYGTLPSEEESSKGSSEKVADEGSSWVGAAFNLTSSTVGAGCIGLGGAIANSGGLVSIVAILTFAILSKFSFDLVVSLGLQSSSSRGRGGNNQESSYEGLGYATYGSAGKLTVILSKGLYSYGCNVAYIKIVQDNFSLAASSLLYGDSSSDGDDEVGVLRSIIENKDLITVILCTTIMFPLCLLRDLAPLERFSILKIIAVGAIVLIVMALFFVLDDDVRTQNSGFVANWLTVQPGVWESLGTFVFTFVSQHTVHLVFQSLKPSERNLDTYGKTTILAVTLATLVSLFLGLFVYMTFWEDASSDLFHLYPPSGAISLCRLLLCASMLLTYPFPLLAVRELLILLLFKPTKTQENELTDEETTTPLVNSNEDTTNDSNAWLLPGSETQLKQPYHIASTAIIWLTTLVLALKASSLGAVLNLTGCALGTMISYILPALFSYKLRGHTLLGTLLLALGGSVGLIGTYYSILAF